MTLYAQDLTRISWECVHFKEDQEITVLMRDLLERGIHAPVLDGRALVTDDGLFTGVAQALQFPSYFGQNWDAFYDCICDLEWLPGTGYALVIRHATALWQETPRTAGQLVNSWLGAAEFWAKNGVPFHLIFLF